MKQDQKEKPFVFAELSEEKLLPLFDEWAAMVAKEKVQRKADHSQEPPSGCLWIIDDLSDSAQLRQRNESVLNKIFTTGRQCGQC